MVNCELIAQRRDALKKPIAKSQRPKIKTKKMEVIFILVEPGEAGNIGAAARAIKTMGFKDLWMVNPVNYLEGEAQWLAHASQDILENAKVFNSLKDALINIDFSVASSAKQRNINADYIPITDISDIIQGKKNIINKLAIVFGRENSGLTNEEIAMCDMVSHVPMQTTFPSLNLSQAVMIYAYELSKKTNVIEKQPHNQTEQVFKVLKNNLIQTLHNIGFNDMHPIYHRIIERMAFIDEKDLKLLNSIAEKVNKKDIKSNI